MAQAAARRGTTHVLDTEPPPAAHGLQGLQGFAAAHGLQGLHGFLAAQGLHAFAAQGLHGLQAASWIARGFGFAAGNG